MGVINDKSYFNAVGKDVFDNEIKNGGIWSFDPTSKNEVLKDTGLKTQEPINSSSFIGIYENKSYFNLNGNIKVFDGSTIEDKGHVDDLNISTYITTIKNKSYFKIDNDIYSYNANFDNANFELVITLTDTINISSRDLILST